MKNHLEYFYNIIVDNISKINDDYKFIYDDDLYLITPFSKDNKQFKQMLEINNLLKNYNILLHEIIYTKNKTIITSYNEKNYILFKINITNNLDITLHDITYLSNIGTNVNFDNNWLKFWTTKIDYFELQIHEMGNKFPLLCEHFSYYIGLAENAISYLNNTLNESSITPFDFMSITHYRVSRDDKLLDFYNPNNLVLDHKTRDLAEYLKSAFFLKKDFKQELYNFFNYNILSEFGVRLLFSRLLFPTYFFDLYEQIIDGHKDEKEILAITSLSEEFEEFLNDIFYYISNFINIPKIQWLIK